MKKLLVLLSMLICCVSFLFAAGNSEVVKTVSDEGRVKTPIEIYDPSFAFPQEKIELNYWHAMDSRPGFHDLLLKIAEEYSKIHPNVTINIRKIPNSQQRTIWAAAFESHTAPDVCFVEAQVGLLNKGLTEAPVWAIKMMEENFTPFAMSLSLMGDKSYGWISSEIDCGQMLYYRKDLFREAGLDPDRPPETIDEMIEYAKKLTKFDEKGTMTQAGIALRYSGGAQGIGDKFSKYASAYLDARKEFFYNEDFTDTILDDDGWLKAAQLFQDLVFKYKVTNTALPIPDEALGQGLAAMTFRESFLAGWLDTNYPDAEYGIAPFVNGDFETGAMPFMAIQGISTDSKYPDVAWDFNMYLVNQENELAIAKNNGGFSRYTVSQDDPFFKTLPYYDVFNIMTKDRPIVRNPYTDPNTLVAELEAKVGEVAIKVVTDPKADARALLVETNAYARKLLADSKK
ncbi:MAG: extracellular solute-binding protein [Sphaerochaetaceae bacterium]